MQQSYFHLTKGEFENTDDVIDQGTPEAERDYASTHSAGKILLSGAGNSGTLPITTIRIISVDGTVLFDNLE